MLLALAFSAVPADGSSGRAGHQGSVPPGAKGRPGSPRPLTYQVAKREADHYAQLDCEILVRCGERSATCTRLTPARFRCLTDAREGDDRGDRVTQTTTLIYRTSKGKLVKELTDVRRFRVGSDS